MITRICLDLNQKGLSMFFKPYEVEVLNLLLSVKPDELNSGEVHKHLLYVAEIMISRASVINCLEKLENYGLLVSTIHTGKGGVHKCYSMLYDSEKFIIDFIERRIVKGIFEGTQ